MTKSENEAENSDGRYIIPTLPFQKGKDHILLNMFRPIQKRVDR